jgi:hypothetical protein
MNDLTLSPVLTSAGLAAVAAAHGQGLQVKITQVAVGSGGFDVRDQNGYPLPAALAKTHLDVEQERVNVFAGAVTGPQQVVVEARIAAGDPNFWVNEVGFFLEDGTLFAIWSSATLNLGYRGDLVPWIFRFVLSWTQLPADAVTVEFNGDAAYADILDRFLTHVVDPNAHPDFLRYNAPRTLEAGFNTEFLDLTVAGGVASFDPTARSRFKHTLTGAIQIANPAVIPNAGPAMIKLVQDATGNRAVDWGSKYRVVGAVNYEANSVSLCHLQYDSADDVIDVVITHRPEA